MRPHVLVAQGVARQAGGQEVLEEAHVLEGEDGDLLLRLQARGIGHIQLSVYASSSLPTKPPVRSQLHSPDERPRGRPGTRTADRSSRNGHRPGGSPDTVTGDGQLSSPRLPVLSLE